MSEAKSAKRITKVLIANRGEIATRVIRAARDLGISTVAVYAVADRGAPFVALADEAIDLEGDTPATSYLDINKLISAASSCGADAIHPGYGFLSENAEFATAVLDAGLTWIGPPPLAIRLLGNKVSARELARKVGAPLAPGSQGPLADVSELSAFVAEYGLPVVIKASFGGGGRGMRVVRSTQELEPQFEAAQREALVAFGRNECFAERYLENPRHVEAQILADTHGRVLVAGLRDCSLQRRHQKVIEEAPPPFLSPGRRALVTESARRICTEAGYVGAGTVEFLVGMDGTVSFLEVNTRLQVEHPVTEETSGLDLVVEQFRIAMGEELVQVEDPEPRGHSIEFRINAEDPTNGFLPAPGHIRRIVYPQGPGVRVDAGVVSGNSVDPRFDSLLAKIIVSGVDRAEVIRRSRRALAEFYVDGPPTLRSLHQAILTEDDFVASGGDASFRIHTSWIEQDLLGRISLEQQHNPGAPALVEIGGQMMEVVLPEGVDPQFLNRKLDGRRSSGPAESGGKVTCPMQGTVASVAVVEGQLVQAGDILFSVEAMKMENAVAAHRAGKVTAIAASVGKSVKQGFVLCEIEDT